VVYTSESKALAALEVLVHLRPNELKMEFVIFEVVFDFAVATLSHLPLDWKEEPAPPSTQALGDEWIEAGASAVLKVPSVLTEEANFLFSPTHTDFAGVTIANPEPFIFDKRLLKLADELRS
jgi:RES domain-containing protein